MQRRSNKTSLGKKFLRCLIAAIFLFGIFPEPFLGWYDEIICWIIFVILIIYYVETTEKVIVERGK